MDYEEALEHVRAHLADAETKMNAFRSALPGYENPNIKLGILEDRTKEYDFGWLFFYNSAKFIASRDFRDALAGNAPLIVDKLTGKLVETGTAHETAYYVNNYIKTGDPNSEA